MTKEIRMVVRDNYKCSHGAGSIDVKSSTTELKDIMHIFELVSNIQKQCEGPCEINCPIRKIGVQVSEDLLNILK
jgi:hypothetical protein